MHDCLVVDPIRCRSRLLEYSEVTQDPEATMDLPVKFPSETDVILEEVARFRALTPEQRFRSLCDLLSTGDLILRNSPTAAWAKQHAEEQEVLAQRAIKEFIARHGS
jgi:hypothetical protein